MRAKRTKTAKERDSFSFQPMLKRLRRHGVKSATFAGKQLVSVEFYPYESYYVDSDGIRNEGNKPTAAQAAHVAPAEALPDTLRSTVLESDKLPDIDFDKTELLPPDDKD